MVTASWRSAAEAGQSAVYLSELGARVTGVDFSERQLACARERARSRGVVVDLIKASAEDLSVIRDEKFDTVFSAFAFGFVERIDRAFAEVRRVLKKGGLFAFSWASPIWACTDLDSNGYLATVHSNFDRSPILSP